MATKIQRFYSINSIKNFNKDLQSAIDDYMGDVEALQIGAVIFGAFALTGGPFAAFASLSSGVLAAYKDNIVALGQTTHMLLEDYEDRFQRGQFIGVEFRLTYDIFDFDYAIPKTIVCIRAQLPNGNWIETA